MIIIISGTNRPGSNTLKVARVAEGLLREAETPVRLLDLAELPRELFDPSAYVDKPDDFAPYQTAVLEAEGLLLVVPEYNGSFPGVLKYFIDMLRFPDSLVDKPAGFIGLSAGRWGALRSIEQLEMVFHYRCAHLYGRRVFLPGILELFDDDGRMTDPEMLDRIREMTLGFSSFCRRLGQSND